ncbi:MAG: FG-GAP repeat protein [Planctomycetes bacterium]|nr:FG-GAP repeat protein [Planctomycetota bacterium]
MASLGDLDGDGVGDLVLGLGLDGDGGPRRGAVWVLFLDGVPTNASRLSTVRPARTTALCVVTMCVSAKCVCAHFPGVPVDRRHRLGLPCRSTRLRNVPRV